MSQYSCYYFIKLVSDSFVKIYSTFKINETIRITENVKKVETVILWKIQYVYSTKSIKTNYQFWKLFPMQEKIT